MQKASTDSPNFDLLLKLLNLASDAVLRGNSAEGILAFKKACDQLSRCNLTWERLLKGKVTILGNPFSDIPFVKPAPPPPKPNPYAAPPKPNPGAQPFAFTSAATARPPARFTCYRCNARFPLPSRSHNGNAYCAPCHAAVTKKAPPPGTKNKYDAPCSQCGVQVPPGLGDLSLDPSGKWKVTCQACLSDLKFTGVAPKNVRPTLDQL